MELQHSCTFLTAQCPAQCLPSEQERKVCSAFVWGADHHFNAFILRWGPQRELIYLCCSTATESHCCVAESRREDLLHLISIQMMVTLPDNLLIHPDKKVASRFGSL